MKKMLAIQITALLVFSGALGSMFVFTDVYNETYIRIVSGVCLSCIKLDRVYSTDYRFETVNGKSNPDFIIDDLEKGPIFLSFRDDVCDYCDEMEPIIQQIFNLSFEKEEVFSEDVDFDGANVVFYHINRDHAEQDLRNLQFYYDIDKLDAVPMFTIITLEYNKGIVSPYYLTVYGILDPNFSDDQRIEELENNIQNAITFYNLNRERFYPQDFKK